MTRDEFTSIKQNPRQASVADVENLCDKIEHLSMMLAKARKGLSCGLWDYGPGQSEHKQCESLIAEIDACLWPSQG